jgi:hypothetical protein
VNITAKKNEDYQKKKSQTNIILGIAAFNIDITQRSGCRTASLNGNLCPDISNPVRTYCYLERRAWCMVRLILFSSFEIGMRNRGGKLRWCRDLHFFLPETGGKTGPHAVSEFKAQTTRSLRSADNTTALHHHMRTKQQEE